MYEKLIAELSHKDTFAKHLDIKIQEIGTDYAITSMPMDERHLNANGVLHGAASFAIADMAFGALASTSGVFTPTITAYISYVSAGTVGPITAKAELTSNTRHTSSLEVKIYDGTSKLIAIYHGTGYKTTRKIIADDFAQTV